VAGGCRAARAPGVGLDGIALDRRSFRAVHRLGHHKAFENCPTTCHSGPCAPAPTGHPSPPGKRIISRRLGERQAEGSDPRTLAVGATKPQVSGPLDGCKPWLRGIRQSARALRVPDIRVVVGANPVEPLRQS